MTFALTGIGVSRGVVAGKAHIQEANRLEIAELEISAAGIDAEVARFNSALKKARQQLKTIRDRIPATTPADIAAFIDTHLLMLEDAALAYVPVDIIRRRHCNAEWALKMQRDELAAVFDEMDDPYLRTRIDDVDHVVNRILGMLLQQQTGRSHDTETEDVDLDGFVIVADDLTPADTILMRHQGIAAFVTEHGGVNSHTAILARSLGIPAIVGVHHVRRYIRQNELIVVDSETGVVLADPDKQMLQQIRVRQDRERHERDQLVRLKKQPTVTRDGHEVSLQANIETPEDTGAIAEVSADGVGLYRTEMLFMNRNDWPDEEEQFHAYLKVVQALNGAPVTIRTLDLGADKQVDGGRAAGAIATNPALGLRAIRLCLKDPTLLFPQLCAILRVSAYGPVRIMLPMLTNLHELSQALQLIHEARQLLRKRGQDFDTALPVGGMIEVPAAALASGLFAEHLDFLSIGTNDLIQYTLAVDRLADDVSHLYEPLHPAVLRLIHMTVAAAASKGIPVSMCGEMAGDANYIPVLLGLGLRELSMHPSLVLEAKGIICNSNTASLSEVVHKILNSNCQSEISGLIETLSNRG